MNDDLIINRIESKIKVLLVSGDVNLKKLLIPYFVKMEISIVVSSSIEEANEVLIANQYDFHLLILTMQNQVDSAVNFISRLRKKHSKSDLPIMYLTSASRNQILSKVFESGCNELLPIPYNTVEFNSKVNSLIELKKLQNMKNELHNLVNVRTKVFRMNTHDLKNPLSSIFSLSGIPIDSFSDKEEISQTFEIIHNAAKIMMSLVNANLEFVNVSSTDIKVEKEQTDIISIVNQIIEINNPLAAKKDQKIIYNYPDMDCNIVTDPNKLYQALNNIIGNAIKFSPIGKKIWVDVVKDIFDEKISVMIIDEGPGFRKDEVDNVFKNFGKHSATPTGDEISTGLGLMITKQLITLLNGEIFLESEEGKGAKFTLKFPIID